MSFGCGVAAAAALSCCCFGCDVGRAPRADPLEIGWPREVQRDLGPCFATEN
jgi:hypothetical protein